MKVLKFGGSSVGNAQRISNVRNIIKQASPCIVVVSAFENITDKLLQIFQMVSEHNSEYLNEIHQMAVFHREMINSLFENKKKEIITKHINQLLNELESTYTTIFKYNDQSNKIKDHVVGFGECLSSYILSEFIECELLDSRQLIKTNADFGNAKVDFSLTNPLIQNKLYKQNKTIVLPGFIASSTDNEDTTLGRGGQIILRPFLLRP